MFQITDGFKHRNWWCEAGRNVGSFSAFAKFNDAEIGEQ
jgi:hypothetical protein